VAASVTRLAVAVADAVAAVIAARVAAAFDRIDYLPAETVKVLAGDASRGAVEDLRAAGWHITADAQPTTPEVLT
jgi:hypothetical protein